MELIINQLDRNTAGDIVTTIQEQQAIITDLKAQLTDINLTLADAKARIEALENK